MDYEARPIRKGVSIIRQASKSPFWNVRFWNAATGKYVVRSLKETSAVFARKEAEAVIADYYANQTTTTKVDKEQSFAFFADQLRQHNKLSASEFTRRDDEKMLKFICEYFDKRNVAEIKTSTMRDYLTSLDEKRAEPLSASTKKKHILVTRKVLKLAHEAGLISFVPDSPKINGKAEPRPSFTEKEYLALLKEARAAATRGDVVRGVKVTRQHYHMIVFLVGSFMRPTEQELFGLKHTDVTVKKDPSHLEILLNAKTGKRTVVTMPVCVPLYAKQVAEYGNKGYVWMPEYENRKTAIAVFRRILNHVLDKTKLKTDSNGDERTPYSLRHFSLIYRLNKSHGAVNLYWLAENAATSVKMLETFYLKKASPSAEKVKNLHITPNKKGA